MNEAPADLIKGGNDERLPLRGPLARALKPKRGFVVLVAGSRGLGKSSLAIGSPALPARVVSCEMDPPTASAYAKRLGAKVDAWRAHLDIDRADLGLEDPVPAFLVVDSLQAHPYTTPVELVEALREWAQRVGSVVFVTSQVRKDGEIAGFEAVPHTVDVVIELDRVDGQRRIKITKNRGGRESEVLFDLDNFAEAGARWSPRYYSIEGSPGNLRAVAWPSPKRARFAGYLAAAAKDSALRGALPPPPAALACQDAGELYGCRWVEPADVAERQKWATENGLPWFTPEGASAPELVGCPATDSTTTNTAS